MSTLITQKFLPMLEGLGPLGKSSTFAMPDPRASLNLFETTLSVALGVLTVSAGIWFIFQVFGGAYQWLASGGEKQGLENARKRITNAIIGLFVVVASYGLILIISSVLGFEILTPGAIVQTF